MEEEIPHTVVKRSERGVRRNIWVTGGGMLQRRICILNHSSNDVVGALSRGCYYRSVCEGGMGKLVLNSPWHRSDGERNILKNGECSK